MGQIFQERLPGHRIYCCSNCLAHAADVEQILSKAFQGRYGPAYLFNKVVNVRLGPKEDRQLITGLHTVNDIYCSCCQQLLGWRYEKAYEEKEKYKEGACIFQHLAAKSPIGTLAAVRVSVLLNKFAPEGCLFHNCSYLSHDLRIWNGNALSPSAAGFKTALYLETFLSINLTYSQS